jgi:hypothetical protein
MDKSITKNNEKKIQDMFKFFIDTKDKIFSPGFYGGAIIDFNIDDGNIQDYKTHIIQKHK